MVPLWLRLVAMVVLLHLLPNVAGAIDNIINNQPAAGSARVSSYDDIFKALQEATTIDQISILLWRLRTIQDQRTINFFIELWEKKRIASLEDKDRMFREDSIQLLACAALAEYGYIGTTDCAIFIKKNASNPHPVTRKHVAYALASLDDTESIQLLERLACDKDSLVGITAIASLKTIALQYSRQTSSVTAMKAREALRHFIQTKDNCGVQFQSDVSRALGQIQGKEVIKRSFELNSAPAYQSTRVYPKNLQLLLPFVEKGDAAAEYEIGNIYLQGQEVQKDISKGITWLKRSASRKYSKAAHALALLYLKGNGISIDEKQGIKWLKVAAAEGDKDAQAELGQAYHFGTWGLPVDHKQGSYWIELARQGQRH